MKDPGMMKMIGKILQVKNTCKGGKNEVRAIGYKQSSIGEL